MTRHLVLTLLAGLAPAVAAAQDLPPPHPVLARIDTIVVIYAENRSFDNLYGLFPGANGLRQAGAATQRDRDGAPLKELPPVWDGLTGPGSAHWVGQGATMHLPNAPFAIDHPKGFNLGLDVPTRDLVHRFYQNQMQINLGRNDGFAAWGDSGALVMGHYDGSRLPMWTLARRFTLADNFFMGAFGGSFLNHFWLVCACTPTYPNADKSPARGLIARPDRTGRALAVAPNSPKSALDGPPVFAGDGALTPGPDFRAVNTMQPPFQPSRLPPKSDAEKAFAAPDQAEYLPPQAADTIGDLLERRGIEWAWYAGAWQDALDNRSPSPAANFQFHHQPLNYFAAFAPGTQMRSKRLRDGGLDGDAFIRLARKGDLPQVSFYKPQGNLNEHPGYAAVLAGDEHIAKVVKALMDSPKWATTLVIVTYDENGGFWDHVAPPRGDEWGPGTRIPTIILSPFARRGHVDHTAYDTTSIIRLIARRFGLPPLPGITARDAAMARAGQKPMGDLTAALAEPAH